MNEKRLKVIIHNLLSEISDYCDMDQKTYYSWLKNEVGITDEEIKELEREGYLPASPVACQKNIGRVSDFPEFLPNLQTL